MAGGLGQLESGYYRNPGELRACRQPNVSEFFTGSEQAEGEIVAADRDFAKHQRSDHGRPSLRLLPRVAR